MTRKCLCCYSVGILELYTLTFNCLADSKSNLFSMKGGLWELLSGMEVGGLVRTECLVHHSQRTASAGRGPLNHYRWSGRDPECQTAGLHSTWSWWSTLVTFNCLLMGWSEGSLPQVAYLKSSSGSGSMRKCLLTNSEPASFDYTTWAADLVKLVVIFSRHHIGFCGDECRPSAALGLVTLLIYC